MRSGRGRWVALVAWLAVGPVVLVALAAPGGASIECEPYPYHRCGAYQRETVLFCYDKDSPAALPEGHRHWQFIFHSPTDENVITVGEPPPALPPEVPLPDTSRFPPTFTPPKPPNVLSIDDARMGLLYLRKAPTEAFLADPYESPLPTQNLYKETNFVAGVQVEPFYCAELKWFAECEPPQWMGPFYQKEKAADERLH